MLLCMPFSPHAFSSLQLPASLCLPVEQRKGLRKELHLINASYQQSDEAFSFLGGRRSLSCSPSSCFPLPDLQLPAPRDIWLPRDQQTWGTQHLPPSHSCPKSPPLCLDHPNRSHFSLPFLEFSVSWKISCSPARPLGTRFPNKFASQSADAFLDFELASRWSGQSWA